MKHLGVLGPIIRAEEGDEVVIVLKNMAKRNYSISPHGALYRYENSVKYYTLCFVYACCYTKKNVQSLRIQDTSVV